VIAIVGGDVVVADHVLIEGTVIVDGERIAAVERRISDGPAGATIIDARGCHVVPGFIDVHVHGSQGLDVLDDGAPVARLASLLPAFGVTAFCPTSVACTPEVLAAFLKQVNRARAGGTAGARVLPAHLESNFVNPEFAGAQPVECLRLPPAAAPGRAERSETGGFSTNDILAVMAAHQEDIGVVTVAPELPGGLDLVQALTATGHRVSLGHSAADYDTAMEAVEAGARHATHLFNRMPPVTHRSPGLVGAMLESPRVAVELIADGVHVHPAICRMAIAAKGTGRVMAISDGTAAAGLPVGATASLGGRRIHARSHAAELDDGTLAGSTATMDRIFATLITRCGVSTADAAAMCALTPARQLGLVGHGVITEGAVADLVVLGPAFEVRHTIVGGRVVFSTVPA
jgi:N-acetylglucosamine-6-phosphate deacetylase